MSPEALGAPASLPAWEARRLRASFRPAGAGRGQPVRLRLGFGRTQGGLPLPSERVAFDPGDSSHRLVHAGNRARMGYE